MIRKSEYNYSIKSVKPNLKDYIRRCKEELGRSRLR